MNVSKILFIHKLYIEQVRCCKQFKEEVKNQNTYRDNKRLKLIYKLM